MDRSKRGAVRRWMVAVVAAVVTVGVGLVGCAVGPAIGDAVLTRVTSADEAVVLMASDASAVVTVPRGWAVRPVVGDAARISLTSPDGVMAVDLVVTRAADAETVARQVASWSGSALREPDGTGRTLVHARADSGKTVVGWVMDSVGIAVVFRAGPSPAYDRELALLLQTIELDR